MGRRSFIAIVGHGPDLAQEGSAAQVLRQLGAEVRTLDLWEDASALFRGDDDVASAIIVEAGARPDIAALTLRALRRERRLEGVGAILALPQDQAARFEPSSGFDDFVLVPLVPAELYARVRAVEWRRSEFSNEERMKIGDIVIDRAAHEVTLDGAVVGLTAREYALLVHLADRRGRVVSREELLERVWGMNYEGSSRTIDIHVTRLRAKLGAALDIVTFRGAGYRLGVPASADRPHTDGQPAPTAGRRA
jgi:DNA-binding response OmpR family regulator